MVLAELVLQLGYSSIEYPNHSSNKKNGSKAVLFLDVYFGLMQNNILRTSISLSALVSAVGCQYKLTKEISVSALSVVFTGSRASY